MNGYAAGGSWPSKDSPVRRKRDGGIMRQYELDRYDMDFRDLSETELISTANDNKALSDMDRGDMLSLIYELSYRLEQLYATKMTAKEL